ncbi:MAG: TusE/DsrC/DsvC family sulfur relay protein [Gammaproteobacteria bacterium]|nr:TusE/DsrC/DsvC family sulfur relay protein [Gammaproteobacteria bacterium]MYD81641.1 TusE/DsrC/DsvC family sulfur relay protein [Gammaproteobacteria bacterium]
MSAIDAEGFLIDSSAWTREFALETATQLGISLTDDHWNVLQTVRDFYLRTGVSPSMRPLVNLVRNVDPCLASSIVLAQMFTSKTSKVVAQLSGIPKPSDCL